MFTQFGALSFNWQLWLCVTKVLEQDKCNSVQIPKYFQKINFTHTVSCKISPPDKRKGFVVHRTCSVAGYRGQCPEVHLQILGYTLVDCPTHSDFHNFASVFETDIKVTIMKHCNEIC